MTVPSVSSSCRRLSAQQALQRAKIHLEEAQREDDPHLILALCADTEHTLTQISRPERKALLHSAEVLGQTLCKDILETYLDLGKILQSHGQHPRAQAVFKKGEKWRHVSKDQAAKHSTLNLRSTLKSVRGLFYHFSETSTSVNLSAYQDERAMDFSDVAHVPCEIFAEPVPLLATEP